MMGDKFADAEWKLDCLNSRMDALSKADADPYFKGPGNPAGAMRSWKVTGLIKGRQEETKIVQARNHNEAVLKGTKEPPIMVVRSVVLQD